MLCGVHACPGRVSWFCSLKGNEFFAEVEHDFMQDDFNLTGLSAQVPYYEYALDTILDSESSAAARFSKDQQEAVESAAELLYGLIHARYIITPRGMAAMLEKVHSPCLLSPPSFVSMQPALLRCDPCARALTHVYRTCLGGRVHSQYKMVHFGRCPRVHCQGQPGLPVGQSDLPRMHTTKIFCCRCEDIYYPRSSRQANVDGAYFGTTFCHLFMQSYWEMNPAPPSGLYVPRIFGFKIHRPSGPMITSAGRAAALAATSGGGAASGAAGGGGTAGSGGASRAAAGGTKCAGSASSDCNPAGASSTAPRASKVVDALKWRQRETEPQRQQGGTNASRPPVPGLEEEEEEVTKEGG